MTNGVAVQQINTFVFTDLVGSTRLTRALPAAVWRRLKDRHDELVRQCAADAGGQVVKGLGDGFMLVFPSEESAVDFGIRLQRAVQVEPWHDGVAPEIRIGMDTGPALSRGEPPDYEGDAVNVASHICARARPGEVLLSARAYFGLRPLLERAGGEVRLEPVGEVRLKGLPTLEPLYHAWAPGLREGFPPLVHVGNLAAHLAPPPFIDREELQQEIEAELRRRPVVTLLGPGGIGKTRLATEIGARLEAEFPAGVWVVPLETIRDGRAVAPEALAALGLRADQMDPDEVLLRHLSDWQGLLILDNVEQLVDEESGGLVRLVGTIARRCPPVRILCSSRIDLRLGASVEARIEVPPLPAPGPRASLAVLRDCPSAQLCAERLRLRVRHFSLDETSARHVAAICRATEGVPLLIELATGHLGRRTLPEIARDVERALAVPSREADRPDRHRDLVRLLDWSLTLLGEERAFFLRLGVFRGSFDPAAAAVVADEPRAEEFLERLMEAHLVLGSAAEDYLAERSRYRLLNANAVYCRMRLGEELPHWQRRHAAYYGDRARAIGGRLTGTAPRSAMAELSQERENLTAALDAALEAGELELAEALGEPLWELLHRLGLWPLVRDSATRLQAAALQATVGEVSSRHALAVATMALAQAAFDEGRVAAAREQYEASLALWRELGEEARAARALHGLGNALRRQDPQAAEQAYTESLALATRRGDEPLRALNLMTLGLIASRQGRREEAEQRHAEAVSLFRGWDDPWGLAIALNSRAQNLELLGQLHRARDLYAESLEVKRELGDRRGTAITLGALSRLLPALGEVEAARAFLYESLTLNQELGDVWGCAVTLGALAERWLEEGEAEAALEAMATAHQALGELGGGSSGESAELVQQMHLARSQIPGDRAEARERRGRETPLMRACDAVLAGNQRLMT